jgi:hypothetical protein
MMHASNPVLLSIITRRRRGRHVEGEEVRAAVDQDKIIALEEEKEWTRQPIALPVAVFAGT